MTENSEYVVKRDNERNIKFKGHVIAEASSSANNASSHYSGCVGRWTELTLYRTAKGKYVCESIGRTQWQGEHDRYSGEVCESADEVIEFFGNGWLAKVLYDEAGIDASITVD